MSHDFQTNKFMIGSDKRLNIHRVTFCDIRI